MEERYSNLIVALFRRARLDPQYAQLAEQYRKLEERYSRMVMHLSQESQDLAWEFICLSDEMNWRMLEILCEDMKIWRSDE